MNAYRRYLELIVLGTCAFVLSKALLSFILDPEETPTEGNPTWRLVLLICYVAVVVVLLPRFRETVFVLRRNRTVVALVLLALLSALWADMPDLVLRKSIGVLGTTIFGIALAVRFSFEEQLRLLSWLFRIIAILSLACVVLFPHYGISDEGEWMGIFEHKNAMGSVMALSVLVESQLPTSTRSSKILRALALCLSAVLLLFADSITPAIALIGALLLIEIYKFAALRLRVPLHVIFLATAILATTGLMMLNSESVTSALGRSSNLTGRTEIWTLVASFIPQRPILGYGYSGFWLGASPESKVVNRAIGGLVMYSHNGYLEMLLTLGLTGLGVTLVFLGIGMKRALHLSKQRPSGTELWPLVFLFFFVLHNLGECTILIQDIEWAMCVSCIAGADPVLLPLGAEQEDELPFVPLEEPT